MSETLLKDIPGAEKDDTMDKVVATSSQLIKDAYDIKQRFEKELHWLDYMLDQTFEITDPTGEKTIPSYLLFQATKKISENTMMPNFFVRSIGADFATRNAVAEGIKYAMRKAGWIDVLEKGFGAFETMYTFGDAFIQVGTNPLNNFPLQYRKSSVKNIFVDPYATDMRNPGSEHDCQRATIVYEYSIDEVKQMYPNYKGTTGDVPGFTDEDWSKPNFERQERQQTTENRKVQIAHYFDIENKVYCIYGGPTASIIKKVKGEKYPFVKDGEPFIPIIHLRCFPQHKGFYGRGIGHLFFRLAMVQTTMQNKGFTQGMRNANPIRMLNVPSAKKGAILNRIREAKLQQDKGQYPIVINEVDGNNPAFSARMDSFTADQLTNEWERIFNQINQIIQRCGINLDSSYDSSKPLGVVEIEQAQQNKFISDILSQNNSEIQFAIECAIDFLKEFVTKESDYYQTPIVSGAIKDKVEGKEVELEAKRQEDQITLGDVADELRLREYYVEVNSKSGAINSDVVERFRLERLRAGMQPGTPAFNKISKRLADLDGIDLEDEDFGVSPEPQQSPLELEQGINELETQMAGAVPA